MESVSDEAIIALFVLAITMPSLSTLPILLYILRRLTAIDTRLSRLEHKRYP